MNDNLDSYLEFLIPDDEDFIQMRLYARQHKVPIIRSGVQKLLEVIIGIQKPVKVLEIGTAIGFSAVVMHKQMLKYCDNPKIKTIENYDKRIAIAKKNLASYEGIELIEGDAYEVIYKLDESFDFIFLDGPKGQYLRYLPRLYELLEEGGIIFIDNVLQNGDVAKSRYMLDRRDRTIHSRMREFLYEITHDTRLQTSVLPLADGVAICRKIERENR